MLNDLNQDFLDLIKSFTSQDVEFMVVGAHALAFHGVARYTEDLDLWIRRTHENVERFQQAMFLFGIAIPDDAVQAMLGQRKMIRFGNKPRRIEILNFLDGCTFDRAVLRSAEASLDGVPVQILSLEDYVATKRASGRPKDESDLTLLREAIGRLPGDL